MHLAAFHACVDSARGYPLDPRQQDAVNHGTGPLWLLAGPGSGKSEALVTRALKLLCVNGEHAASIFLTTFTKKAAHNLEDRLAEYLSALQSADPALRRIDLADMRIGTLHSLSNDILQEFRYREYQNVRLLDEVEQHLFAYRSATITRHDDLAFWTHFQYAVPSWGPGGGHAPGRWKRVKAAILLFNHIVEDVIALERMDVAGRHWRALADFYRQYAEALRQHHRCDFAHLQARFLDFLGTAAARPFLGGDGDTRPPMKYVLVDEYQDTNPIQERIYLELASASPHNLTVVGDDDQALYRFRGGTVSCMVNFDSACNARFGVAPTTIPLDTNYRSHGTIVEFVNDYIESFPEMNSPGVRVPGKGRLRTGSGIAGAYPSVGWLARASPSQLPDALAEFVKDHLLGDGIIQDLSQCVLLMRSTKDSPLNAGPYLAAFERWDIPVHNPRSKAFMESEEVQCLLAALTHVVDHNHNFMTDLADIALRNAIQGWFVTLDHCIADSTLHTAPLEDYIRRSESGITALCAANPGGSVDLSLTEITYRILSVDPFRSWRDDPVRRMRLSKVTRLLDSYHSLNLDALWADVTGLDVDSRFRLRYYYMLAAYLVDAGISDDEDEDVIVPQKFFPFMTIHQSKGLQFPFVFVAQVGQKGPVGAAQILEDELAPFRHELYPRSTRAPALLAVEDDIRLLYVAYSRAQNGVVLVATPQQIRNHVAVPGRDYVAFRRDVPVVTSV